jgi:hypothetical protein
MLDMVCLLFKDGLMNKSAHCELKLAGLKLSVLRREFPDSHDIWDGNWLNVIGECKTLELNVKASGPFLSVAEFADLLEKLKQVDASANGRARVQIMEPTLDLTFRASNEGQIILQVSLQADGHRQSTQCEFQLEKNIIDLAIVQCQAILQAYPMRCGAEAETK